MAIFYTGRVCVFISPPLFAFLACLRVGVCAVFYLCACLLFPATDIALMAAASGETSYQVRVRGGWVGGWVLCGEQEKKVRRTQKMTLLVFSFVISACTFSGLCRFACLSSAQMQSISHSHLHTCVSHDGGWKGRATKQANR